MAEVTRYFYDTEFNDDGVTIDLISIGIVSDDGRWYYAVSNGFDVERLRARKWLLDNVWPHLPLTDRMGPEEDLDLTHPDVKSRSQIAAEVKDFLLFAHPPELWAWYAAFDHVVYSQLFGEMIDIPVGLPWSTYDIKQEYIRLGCPELPPQDEGKHHALADAKHDRLLFESLRAYERRRGARVSW